MKTCALLFVLVAAASAVPHQRIARQTTQPTCASKYLKTAELHLSYPIRGHVHTMCKYPRSSNYLSGGISQDDITRIVDTHNERRKNSNPSVTAAAMCKMYWDPNIARIAQHYADSCPTGHDKNRVVPGYGWAFDGQNIARNFPNWTTVINAWYGEVRYFEFGVGATDATKMIGHYTQVVKDTSCRVGCGFANCAGTGPTFVCNYPTGNIGLTHPFVTGAPCSKCPNTCVDGKLCDTGGKMCYHGRMNYTTNTCMCDDPYTGESCEILRCDGTQHPLCPYQQESQCQFGNIRRGCPIKCDLCNDDMTAGDNFLPAPAVTLNPGSDGETRSYPAGRLEGDTAAPSTVAPITDAPSTVAPATAAPSTETTRPRIIQFSCREPDHSYCYSEAFHPTLMCYYSQDVTVDGDTYSALALCPHVCHQESGCYPVRTGCVDHTLCADPTWFDVSDCGTIRSQYSYGGAYFTPDTLCPRSCGVCCEDHPTCADPGWFTVSNCNDENHWYGMPNGEVFTPLTMCPQLCGQC